MLGVVVANGRPSVELQRVGGLGREGGTVTMSASEPAAVHSAGPTIEWLEPKLPDILKNGSSSLGSFTTGEGPLEGSRLELSSPESCSFSGVRPRGEAA